MMEDVQEGYLSVLFAEHKENGFHKVYEFVHQVQSANQTLSILIFVIHRQANNATDLVGFQDKQEVNSL